MLMVVLVRNHAPALDVDARSPAEFPVIGVPPDRTPRIGVLSSRVSMSGPCNKPEGKLAISQLLAALGGLFVDVAAQVEVGPLLGQAVLQEARGIALKPGGRMVSEHDEQVVWMSRVKLLE
jgi:hypothetical protein